MRRVLIMLALLLALTACGEGATPTTTNPTNPPPAAGSDLSTAILGNWSATTLGGAALIPGSTITIQFENGGQVSGRVCNSIGGSYTVDGEGLRFGQLMQTEMACMEPAGVMEQETRFAQALASTSSARIEGTTLRLFDATGQEVLAFTRM